MNELHVHRSPSRLYVSRSSDENTRASLSVHCSTGTVSIKSLPNSDKVLVSSDVEGVLGLAKLVVDSYLVLLKRSEFVCFLAEHSIRRVVEVDFVPLTQLDRKDADEPYMEMLRNRLSSKNMYFSWTHDLTRNFQSITKHPDVHPCKSQFLWNSFILREFQSEEMRPFVVHLISGLVAHDDIQLCQPFATNGQIVNYVLISRRSHRRTGARYMCRGIDTSGHCANFVETEQLIMYSSTDKSMLFSHVQVRGSIPLFWRQTPNLMYKPIPILLPRNHTAACRLHFKELEKQYGDVVVVNLIDHKGPEKMLENGYHSMAQELSIP
ncbi:hypothetical protein ACOME3_008401 [Neoechinorhynchus agilis]